MYPAPVCVVSVCFPFYLSVYLWFARCVFCVLFHIHNHLCFFSNSIFTYVTVPIDIRIALHIFFCLLAFITGNSNLEPLLVDLFAQIHAYLWLPFASLFLFNSCVCASKHVYAYVSSLYPDTPIAISICDCYVMFTHNLYIPTVTRLYVPVSTRGKAQCIYTCDHIVKGLYFNIHTFLYVLWLHIYHLHTKMLNPVYTFSSHMCVLQPRLDPYLLHPPNTYSCHSMYVYTKTVQ